MLSYYFGRRSWLQRNERNMAKTVLIIDDTVKSRHIENKNNYTKTVT